MLIYVYLLLLIFLQAAAAFEPISFDVNRVEDAKNVTKEVSQGSQFGYMGDIMKRGVVEVSVWTEHTYVITLGVGSTNEVVNVLVDFTSPDLTVLSSETWNKKSTSPGTFNYSQSTTFKRNETFYSYVCGRGTGFWGQDDITIGNVTVKGLDFGVQNVSNSFIGTLGLGLPEWESTYENSDPYVHESMPMKMKNQGIISKVAYSIYHRPRASYNADNGTLLFGAVDHAKYSGPLTTLPMIKYNSTGVKIASNLSTDNFIRKHHIHVLLHGIQFSVNTEEEGQTMTITNNTYYAAFEPLYGITSFPRPLVEAMARAIGAQYLTEHRYWLAPCVDDENVVFLLDFGGVTIRVPLYSLLLNFDGSSCMLNIFPMPGLEEVIVLGHTILKHAYLVFDLDDLEVSIAQGKLSKMVDIQEIVSQVPGAVKGSTQTTIGNITSETKVAHMFTYKTRAASDTPSFFISSESKGVSSTWIMVLIAFASSSIIIYRL